ncbi:50S ribosomal protein L10 [Candidatus Parcubacteria bacterium]|nr:MAG: 50S ribosomal protein L10 [Candidatus Parcubacteria bacterium]
MAKTKLQKQEILRDLDHKIKDSKSIVFTEFNALGVKQNEELRNKLKEQDSEYLVVKKTLLDIALKNGKLEGFDPKSVAGKLSVVFGYQDEVAPAKIVDEFKKDNPDQITFVGGVLENAVISADQVEALAKMPSKPELYAKIVGSINAPVSGFVNVLAGNMRSLVYALNAIKEQKN